MLKVWLLLLFVLGTCNGEHEVSSEDKTTLINKIHSIYAIENGYEKSGVEFVDFEVKHRKRKLLRMISELKTNVVCGLTYIALSYMRISKHLLLWYGEDLLDSAVGQIESFNEHALNMITVLYNLGYENPMIGMWYFYIYSSKIGSFRARIDKDKQNDAKLTTFELASIHDNVIVKLSMNVQTCDRNKHNIASMDHTLHGHYKYLSTSNAGHKEIIAVIEAYKRTVSGLINDNKTLQYGCKNASKLTVDRLYLNGVVSNEDIMNELQSHYDSKIVWGDAADVLKNTYSHLIDNPSVMFDNLRGIQRFQMLFKNLLLTIVLRFVWSHLIITGHPNRDDKLPEFCFLIRVHHQNNEFTKLLEPFLRFLQLHNHPGLKELLFCLQGRTLSCVKSGEGVEIVERELTTIGIGFNNFNPMDGSLYDDTDLAVSYDKLVSFAKKNSLPTKYRRRSIRKYAAFKQNHTRLSVFINRVQYQILQNVDFELMHMLFSNTSFTTLDKFKTNKANKMKFSEGSIKKYEVANTESILYVEKIDEIIETASDIDEENSCHILYETCETKNTPEDQSQSKPDDDKTDDAEDKKKPEYDSSSGIVRDVPIEDGDTNTQSSVWYKGEKIGEETPEDKKEAETKQAPEEVKAPISEQPPLEIENHLNARDSEGWSAQFWESLVKKPEYLYSVNAYNAKVEESQSDTE
ncbi:uncharacterized protein LOC126834517 [Adelges cooleyi]|uniref:uncharacterized protein LOC126834517 n=1 Tax=Adelges cooleyi TaxID=133065 RepID=UPI0021801D7A|nr:uncharacterized protein LOC126834517 [Adelges cooleyi]